MGAETEAVGEAARTLTRGAHAMSALARPPPCHNLPQEPRRARPASPDPTPARQVRACVCVCQGGAWRVLMMRAVVRAVSTGGADLAEESVFGGVQSMLVT